MGQHETPQERDARMQWFRDARFGLFIHWGPYSVLGGEYKGRLNGWAAEWIQHTERIPLNEYEQVAASFEAAQFDARQWVTLAKDAGMKYIAITAKHHDGFCLWDSKLTDYTSVRWAACRRDLIGELADECRRAGIKLGLYYSVRDWHHPDWSLRYEQLDAPGPNYRGWWGCKPSPLTNNQVLDCGCPACQANVPITHEVDPRPSGADMNRYLDYMKGQLTELLTNYGPIGIMWFDAQDIGDPVLGRVEEMVATMRGLRPGVIINDRIGPDAARMGDYGVHEGSIPGTNQPREWETCMTLNGTWGFSRHNQNWMPAVQAIRMLADTTSKGGNLLLNVGPDGQGVIPPGSVERLLAVGAWMKINGASIYGCGPSGLTQPAWGRITAKGSTLYLHVFDWPSDGQLEVAGSTGPVKRAYVLADAAQTDLAVSTGRDSTVIHLPPSAADADDTVIVLER